MFPSTNEGVSLQDQQIRHNIAYLFQIINFFTFSVKNFHHIVFTREFTMGNIS